MCLYKKLAFKNEKILKRIHEPLLLNTIPVAKLKESSYLGGSFKVLGVHFVVVSD